MKLTFVLALGFAVVGQVAAQGKIAALLSALGGGDASNDTCVDTPFPDLSKATGLSDMARQVAQKCENQARKIPSCGISCLENAASSVNCSYWDFPCQCQGNNPSTIRMAAIACVINNCPIPKALRLQTTASDICGCAGLAVPKFSTTGI